MDTFNTDRSVDKVGYDNSVFLRDEDEHDKIEANGNAKTLPSKASLIVANDTSGNDPNQNEQTIEAKTVIPEQKQANGDVKPIEPSAPPMNPELSRDVDNSAPNPELSPETGEQNNVESALPKGSEEETKGQLKRTDSGLPYEMADMESALDEVKDDE